MKTEYSNYLYKPNYIDVSFYENLETLLYTQTYEKFIKFPSDIGRWHIKYKNNEKII